MPTDDFRNDKDQKLAAQQLDAWQKRLERHVSDDLPVDADIVPMRQPATTIGEHLQDFTAELIQSMYPKEKSFFEEVAEQWESLFGDLPARPLRYANGYFVLGVKTPAIMYSVRPKCRQIRTALAKLPHAPTRFNLKLEIQA